MSSATSCLTHHNMTELSFFSSSISSLLLLLTVPSNAFVIVALLSNKKMLKKSAFHKILLNIAVADLFTGLVSDPTSISFHTKEGLKQSISTHEVKLLHCSLFLFNTASVLTMALLCVDRMVAIKFPFKYRLGLSNTKSALLTAGVWAVAGLLLIPYFSMGYIKYLTVFSFATVAIAFVSLVLFVVVYRKKFNVRPETTNTSNAVSSEANLKKTTKTKRHRIGVKPSTSRKANPFSVIMLLVFLLTYLPACVMTAYMNLCQNCHCNAIHVMRDLTYLAILSSAFFRPLNFMMKLTIFKKKNENLSSTQLTSNSSS